MHDRERESGRAFAFRLPDGRSDRLLARHEQQGRPGHGGDQDRGHDRPTTCVRPFAQNAFSPFGVPTPVGPSYPTAPLHIVVPHEPFDPVVTSCRLDVCPYASDAG